MLGCPQVMGCGVEKNSSLRTAWSWVPCLASQLLPLSAFASIGHSITVLLFCQSIFSEAQPIHLWKRLVSLCRDLLSQQLVFSSLGKIKAISSRGHVLSPPCIWNGNSCIYTLLLTFPITVLYFMFFWFPWSSLQGIECGEKLETERFGIH